MRKTSEDKKKWPYVAVLIFFVVVIGLWCYCGGLCAVLSGREGSVEALSPLFAGLAFVGLLLTLIMQREELALQRQELACTREELAQTKEATQKLANEAEETKKNQLWAATLTVALEKVNRLTRDIERFKVQEGMTQNPHDITILSNRILEAWSEHEELQHEIDNLWAQRLPSASTDSQEGAKLPSED